jgi:DNA repair exonuclease SbcCD ATPase subunit
MTRSDPVTDSENEKSSSSETNNLGAGKDVLFGWLVGRAAADLGLAQALASSEAQRAEQFKRLEDALLAQIHQLQQQLTSGPHFDVQVPDLNELKAHMQSFAERLSGVESVSQQATQMRELVKTEMARLHSQLGDREILLETQRSRFDKLEATVGAKIEELEQVIGTKSEGFDTASDELEHIRRELGAITNRITRAELATQQATAQAASDVERAQEHVAGLVTSESAALKAELLARLDQPLSDLTVKRIEETFQKRLDDLHRELGQNLPRVDAEVHGLQTQVQILTQRVESLPSATAAAIDFDVERSRWSRDVDERITGRVQELGNEIRDKLESVGSIKIENDHFLTETSMLAHRMAQNEQATQQMAVDLGMELSAIKAALNQQQMQQQATEAVVKSFEDTVRTKIREVQDYLLQGQNNLHTHEAQFTEYKTDLQRLTQRFAEIESIAHRTHALMVNESEQATQVQAGLRTELAGLRTQLSEGQSMGAVIQSVEDNLTVKLRELQNQFAQKMLVADRRDEEFREIKLQLQTLAQKMAQAGATPSAEVPAANRTKDSTVFPVDIDALRSKSEARLGITGSKTEIAPHGTRELSQEHAEAKDSLLDGSKHQLTQLQERMSADIERARAELREKSGRWKVRR